MSDPDSSLSSAISTDDEKVAESINRSIGLEKYFKKAKPVQPPSPQPPPSPPHDYVLADNPDIPFIVMFRSRFTDAFPKSLPHYGPQEIENGVTEPIPGDHIERLLCALLGLVLNRKKEVERGHYQRALEEAVHSHASQWPNSWEGKNPLHGGGSFTKMTPDERLLFLKTLILWSLSSSEAIQAKLKECYKQTRHDSDRNQPLSVQPWGSDTYKRRYWLIEGRDDTHFRLYRESNPALKTNTWWSVAGTIPELRAVAESLGTEKSRAARDLSEKIYHSIPRFEGSEEKRKRRDYRLARKAAFARPEPGFSLYEGRTRGKRIKYTFSDDEDFSSEAVPSRRSTRNQSGASTPPEPAGPTFTASGRQVKARVGGLYGQAVLGKRRLETTQDESSNNSGSMQNGRATRNRPSTRTNGWVPPDENHAEGYNSMDETDEEAEAASSENEWNGGDDDIESKADEDEEENEEASDSESLGDNDNDTHHSLIIKLRYGQEREAKRPKLDPGSADLANEPAQEEPTKEQPMKEQPVEEETASTNNTPLTSAPASHLAENPQQASSSTIEQPSNKPEPTAFPTPPPQVDTFEKQDVQSHNNGVL